MLPASGEPLAIHDAFCRGDLDALRAAVGDPAAIPNGRMPEAIGPCLVYAIYHSPLAFIRTLLELGADPKAPREDGFPPLIAALSCLRHVPGATRRADVDEIIRLLLAFGADPNQRGINDYAPLHMAVAERSVLAVQLLLDGGADPELRTRIDEHETPLEMANAAGLADIAALLVRKGKPLRERLRSGVTLLADFPGTGETVRRQLNYRIRLRMWLNDGETVQWIHGAPRIAEVTNVRMNRGSIISGLFYGLDGMRIGGTRRLDIAPHMAYGDNGVPGVIPPRARVTLEVTVLEEVP